MHWQSAILKLVFKSLIVDMVVISRSDEDSEIIVAVNEWCGLENLGYSLVDGVLSLAMLALSVLAGLW